MNNSKNPAILYIEARKKQESISSLDNSNLSNLPKELFLVYSIQYKSLAINIKKQLINKGVKVKGFKQVLGCSKLKSNYPILLIGSGRFHALNLALQNSLPIYIYNIANTGKITEFDEKELEEIKTNKKAALNKFFLSNKIGILVSTKPGQQKLKQAQELKKEIEKKYPEKRCFIFISNNINTNEFENFQIPVFINTACLGLAYDSNKILNSEDIRPFLVKIP